MSTKRSMKQRIEELSQQLIFYKDLYRQSSDSRDFWKHRENKTIDLVRVTQNKLRDEKDLCDRLAEFADFVVNNYHHLTPADIKRGKTLSKMHKEARYVR